MPYQVLQINLRLLHFCPENTCSMINYSHVSQEFSFSVWFLSKTKADTFVGRDKNDFVELQAAFPILRHCCPHLVFLTIVFRHFMTRSKLEAWLPHDCCLWVLESERGSSMGTAAHGWVATPFARVYPSGSLMEWHCTIVAMPMGIISPK